MKRTYISPEFRYDRVNGTLSMREESSFFGSKMLEIEDSIVLENQNLVWYQTLDGEQIDESIESSLPPISYSASESKRINHTLIIDPNQSQSQRDSKTRYTMVINLEEILTSFLFGTLKQFRTFEGVRNNMVVSENVDFSIREYITKNVIDRYKFDKIQLFLRYNDLRGQNILRFKNNWNNLVLPESERLQRFETQTEFDDTEVTINFNQEELSSLYSFDYYFKLFWTKI
jgi:hypothetical protein